MNSMQVLSCMVPLFCATCFWRYSANRKKFRVLIRREIESRFEVVYGECPPESQGVKSNRELIRMLQLAERYGETDAKLQSEVGYI